MVRVKMSPPGILPGAIVSVMGLNLCRKFDEQRHHEPTNKNDWNELVEKSDADLN